MTMNIRSDQSIAGHPAIKVRLLLRHIQLHDSVTTKFIARVMDINDSQERKLSRKLEQMGFLSKLDPAEQKKLASRAKSARAILTR
jgi:hypothetical protein